MPRENEDHRRKERRNRWIRWTIAMLLAGAGGLYATDRIRDAEAEIDNLELRVVGDSVAAVEAGETILALGNRVVELENLPPVEIEVPGPIRWRTRIDSFPVPGPERIVEVKVVEIDSIPYAVPGPLRVDTLWLERRVWTIKPLEIAAGFAGGLVVGLVIGGNGESDPPSSVDDYCQRYPDRC